MQLPRDFFFFLAENLLEEVNFFNCIIWMRIWFLQCSRQFKMVIHKRATFSAKRLGFL